MQQFIRQCGLFIFLTFAFISGPTFASQSFAHHPTYDVIVVGGGISGLAAAHELKTHGYRVLVLEARTRLGGRIHTVQYNKIPLELGASWIHGINHNPLIKLAQQSQLKTHVTQASSNSETDFMRSLMVYDSTGKKLSDKKIALRKKQLELFEDYVSNIKNKQHISFQMAMEQFIRQHHLRGKDLQEFKCLVHSAIVYEYAADLKRLSIYPYFKNDFSGKDVLVINGYAKIITQLSKKLAIHLNQIVKEISYQHANIAVKTQNNVYHAKAVIVSIPLGVLKAHRVHFTPALPRYKEKAIASLGFGLYNKVYLIFNKQFWDNKVEWIDYLPKNKNSNWIEFMNYAKYLHQPVLLAFSAGDFAQNEEQKTNAAIVNDIMQVLRTIYGKHIPNPMHTVITRWRQDSFAKGSYSYLPKGISPKIYDEMAAPVANKLFFAGEATNRQHPSTVHGAYLSGLRAAHEVEKTLFEYRQ